VGEGGVGGGGGAGGGGGGRLTDRALSSAAPTPGNDHHPVISMNEISNMFRLRIIADSTGVFVFPGRRAQGECDERASRSQTHAL